MITYRVLGQSNPAATTATTLYTVPAATATVTSTLTVANLGTATATYKIAIRPAGATLEDKHYVTPEVPIAPNDAVFLTVGFTLAATDVVTIQASTADLAFNLFGSEVS